MPENCFCRISEMTMNVDKFKMQVSEKERQIAMLQHQPVPQTDSTDALIEPTSAKVTFAPAPPTIDMDEMEAMHEALRCIAQEVINDTEQANVDDTIPGKNYTCETKYLSE